MSFRQPAEFFGVSTELVGLGERAEQVPEGGGLVVAPGELGRERACLHVRGEPPKRREEQRLDPPGVRHTFAGQVAEQRPGTGPPRRRALGRFATGLTGSGTGSGAGRCPQMVIDCLLWAARNDPSGLNARAL